MQMQSFTGFASYVLEIKYLNVMIVQNQQLH